MSVRALLASALLAGTALLGPARAEMVAALVEDDTLAFVNTDSRTVERKVKITGIVSRVLGLDVRPADGQLYALVADGSIVTLDPSTGRATPRSRLDVPVPQGALAIVDFNPVADRLRVIGLDGTSLRVNVEDGKAVTDKPLRFADADANKDKRPRVVAGAYTNAVKGATETTLFDVDAAGTLLRQAPPNDGILNTVGTLAAAGESFAFDIAPDGAGGNAAFLMAGSTLYRVDLAAGRATELATITGLDGRPLDIAVLPKTAP